MMMIPMMKKKESKNVYRCLSSASNRVEVAIIGAGVVGLAVARALALAGKEVLILERETSFGTGTSSRNSEVIHAGIYYPPNSLKAKLCVRGKELLYQYAEERNISHKRLGKLIVATTSNQTTIDLPKIRQQAEANGVMDLRIVSGEDVRSMFFEPQVQCQSALFSPSTGIIDSHSLMMSFLSDMEASAGSCAFGSPLEDTHSETHNFHNNRGIQLRAGGMDLLCDAVVNCSGLHAHLVTQTIFKRNGWYRQTDNNDNNTKVHQPPHQQQQHRQFFAKGNYYRLEGQPSPFTHLVYPVPEHGGLGVHATVDLGGNTRFGPDVQWIEPSITNPDDIDLTVDPMRVNLFYDQVRRYWPNLCDGALVPDYAGIRPKLIHPTIEQQSSSRKDQDENPSDFWIESSSHDGFSTFINLLGIESPGLTSSMAIGEVVTEMLSA